MKELEPLEADSKKQALAEIERQRIETEKEGKRLLVTEDSITAMTNAYRISIQYNVNKKYRELILLALKPCHDTIYSFFTAARSEVGAPAE